MGWHDRTFMQKVLLIISICAVIAALACFAANLTTTIKASTETWFVPCSKCKGRGGDKECGNSCCQDGTPQCSTKQAAFFYILRIYSMLFAVMCVMGEVTALSWYFEYLKVFRFYWGRGLLHIFVGFMTINGNVAPDDKDAATFAEILGWIIISMGGVHIILSALCFKEYSKDQREETLHGTYSPPTTEQGANPSGI